MILYIFITHKKNINCRTRIIKMMREKKSTNFIIVVGDTKTYYDPKTKLLRISCNDNYEGLPEKIIKTYNFVHNSSIFLEYTHFCKLDDDMIINKLIDINLIKEKNYYGNVLRTLNGDRKWHIGKCSTTSKFNNCEYNGIYVPWCGGGFGYILSRYSLSFIINDNTYKDEIYEDLYIAKMLLINNIKPEQWNEIKKYILSPEHSI